MDRKIYGLIVFGIVAVFAMSGCETVPKKFKEEVSGIKSRVDTLEARVETVETKQIETERNITTQAAAVEDTVKTNISVKQRTGKGSGKIKDIQACLKNAGFYDGKIDGIKGKNTRKAIREFQSAHGLKADGIVGSKTWEALAKYEAGAGKGYTEEGALTK